jgi:CelD/BcsL family acetyltransferase involved in cellulose biosynthesis
MTLCVREIQQRDEFLALEKEWDALLECSGMSSPFLSHAWFQCCLEAYGGGKTPAIMTVLDGGRLVGVAPCWRYHDPMRGVPLRRLGFMTCPDTPFCDLIVAPERRSEVIRTFVNLFCREGKQGSDVVTFDLWWVQSPNFKEFHGQLKASSIVCHLERASQNPFVPLSGTWSGFMESKSQRFRKTYRNVTNRVQRLGNIEVICELNNDSGTVMDSVLAVSAKGWKHQEGLAITSSTEARRFFERLTDIGARKGWLMVWLLRLDGVPIAMEYDLVSGKTVYALRSDFDERYKEHSPGSYLEYEIMKRLLADGFVEYNTGPGLNAYKLKWTNTAREHVRMHLFGKTARGRWCQASETVFIPMIKRVKALCGGDHQGAVA